MIDKSKLQEILDYYENKARFSQADYEARAKGENVQKSRDRAVRDIMRFIQILDEAIGGHD